MTTHFADYMRVQSDVERRLREISEPLSLTPVELYVLYGLSLKSLHPHASTLARFVGRAATSFTPTLDGLEDVGLIQRCPDKLDRRAVIIELTNTGLDLMAAVQVAVAEAEAAIAELWLSTPAEVTP